jgi:hypothetical protein
VGYKVTYCGEEVVLTPEQVESTKLLRSWWGMAEPEW